MKDKSLEMAIPLIGVGTFAYLSLSCFVFQLRHPKANDYSWFTNLKPVLTWESVEEYR
jgi:hypothetical protein